VQGPGSGRPRLGRRCRGRACGWAAVPGSGVCGWAAVPGSGVRLGRRLPGGRGTPPSGLRQRPSPAKHQVINDNWQVRPAQALNSTIHALIGTNRLHVATPDWLICGYLYWCVAGVLKAWSAGASAESGPLFGRRRRFTAVRRCPARRNMHAYQSWFRQECAFGPLRQPQCPALGQAEVLPRDRHGHLSLADGHHGAAGQGCPVVVNRIGLRRARDRQLVSAKPFRAAFRCRNMGNRVRCRIYRVSTPRRESAYDTQQRNRCGLADAQHDHPLSTLPAPGGDTAFRGGRLRYCRPCVTHFLLTGGKTWPFLA